MGMWSMGDSWRSALLSLRREPERFEWNIKFRKRRQAHDVRALAPTTRDVLTTSQSEPFNGSRQGIDDPVMANLADRVLLELVLSIDLPAARAHDLDAEVR